MGSWRRGAVGDSLDSQSRAGWLRQDIFAFAGSLCTEGSQIFLGRLAPLGL